MSVRWWSIEVRDGVLSAQRWKDGYGEALLEAAVTHGAKRWEWTVLPGGVVLELAFREAGEWERFRALPVVTAALDATPDPVNGLYVYPGRGGSASSRSPRKRPRPTGAGAAAMPIPEARPQVARLAVVEPPAEPITELAESVTARSGPAGTDRVAGHTELADTAA
ncbi:hypothetical protein [Paractinoplanes rishiriensis]|uniref:Uncharacterized protein n=1 Tax=Paractinoplanes rishiriensis TaxID=1050105 RepID=A0A919K4U6_9ACTN|nr:hypothetical protein [Actinoplanes rishiriensis]GIE98862.1 hypothetical protein Ari01nite_63270 [Actinoplanes rishiriensis]